MNTKTFNLALPLTISLKDLLLMMNDTLWNENSNPPNSTNSSIPAIPPSFVSLFRKLSQLKLKQSPGGDETVFYQLAPSRFISTNFLEEMKNTNSEVKPAC